MATKKVDLADLIDIPTGAGLIFVTKKTIANWLSQGKLSRFKVAEGRTLISKRELIGLIKKAD
jgi:hypothetical protein